MATKTKKNSVKAKAEAKAKIVAASVVGPTAAKAKEARCHPECKRGSRWCLVYWKDTQRVMIDRTSQLHFAVGGVVQRAQLNLAHAKDMVNMATKYVWGRCAIHRVLLDTDHPNVHLKSPEAKEMWGDHSGCGRDRCGCKCTGHRCLSDNVDTHDSDEWNRLKECERVYKDAEEIMDQLRKASRVIHERSWRLQAGCMSDIGQAPGFVRENPPFASAHISVFDRIPSPSNRT